MDDPEYGLRVFNGHWARSRPQLSRDEISALELGPGDSLASAVIANAHGIKKLTLLDTGPYAHIDMTVYHAVAQMLNGRGLRATDISACADIAAMCRACGAEYLTDGVRSLEKMPSGSIDWIWSQAVLEHIRLAEVERMLVAMRRVMCTGGIASHRIDLQDHLGGNLNNLRFSEDSWERDGFAYRSGFYTNRIRSNEWLRRFEAADFKVVSVAHDEWPAVPIQRRKLAEPFSQLTDGELKIKSLDLVVRAI
jgi:hypothetical protein